MRLIIIFGKSKMFRFFFYLVLLNSFPSYEISFVKRWHLLVSYRFLNSFVWQKNRAAFETDRKLLKVNAPLNIVQSAYNSSHRAFDTNLRNKNFRFFHRIEFWCFITIWKCIMNCCINHKVKMEMNLFVWCYVNQNHATIFSVSLNVFQHRLCYFSHNP